MKNIDLRTKYIEFFESKNHVKVPSGPVVPENDPSVLFNTAGMQPLVPYLKGLPHPYGKRLCDYQKCVRTNDLDSVGDTTHHTFFEMLGNWSLGDYFKKESVEYSFEFLTKVLEIPLSKLAVTVFRGNDFVSPDDETASYWINCGIPKERIAYLAEEDNWWPSMELTGLCGPDTEIFYWRSSDPVPVKFDPEDKRWVEIWNNVFMQYMHEEDGSFTELPSKNVDTGMGMERVTAILEGKTDNYTSSIWQDIIDAICEISGKTYEGNEKEMRVIADHIRCAVFIAADPAGIKPSNLDQGYVLRRLIRRTIRYARKLEIDIENSNFEEVLARKIIDKYYMYYPELKENEQVVIDVLKTEKQKFSKTLDNGLKEFEKVTSKMTGKVMDKDMAFRLYDTFGFPLELTVELACEKGIKVDEAGFMEKFKEHQEKSRSGSEAKFKGGLASHGDMEIKYHTVTHLVNAALKLVVGEAVHQKGSNITAERMRFDFLCDHKLTEEEKAKVTAIVNGWIDAKLNVTVCEMNKADAIKSGAECMFIEKYPDVVTVYTIEDGNGGYVSKELCGGPHVKNTSELKHIKIAKEEAVSSGIRRVKVVFEE